MAAMSARNDRSTIAHAAAKTGMPSIVSVVEVPPMPTCVMPTASTSSPSRTSLSRARAVETVPYPTSRAACGSTPEGYRQRAEATHWNVGRSG